MGRLFRHAIAISLLSSIFSGQGFAETVPGHSRNISQIGETGVFENQEGVRVYYINRLLQDVLQEIQGKTGIQFKLQEEVKKISITADVRASDWELALDRLFMDYNTIKFWDGQSNLSRIHVLGQGRSQPSSHFKPEVTLAPKREKAVWKCFSLSGQRKC